MRKLITLLTIFSTFFFFVETPYVLAVDSVAFDTSGGNTSSGAGPFTLAITPTGTNRHVVCAVEIEDATDTVSGTPTFGGTTMHLLQGPITVTTSGPDVGYLYDLPNPGTGSQTFSVSVTGSVSFITLMCANYTGALQSNFTNSAQNSANANGNTALTAAITISAATSWAAALFVNNANTELIDSSGWVTRQNPNSARLLGDSNTTLSAGSYNVTGHCSGVCTNGSGIVIAVEIPVVSTITFSLWQFFGW